MKYFILIQFGHQLAVSFEHVENHFSVINKPAINFYLLNNWIQMFVFHQVLEDWRSVKFYSYDTAFFFLFFFAPFLLSEVIGHLRHLAFKTSWRTEKWRECNVTEDANSHWHNWCWMLHMDSVSWLIGTCVIEVGVASLNSASHPTQDGACDRRPFPSKSSLTRGASPFSPARKPYS